MWISHWNLSREKILRCITVLDSVITTTSRLHYFQWKQVFLANIGENWFSHNFLRSRNYLIQVGGESGFLSFQNQCWYIILQKKILVRFFSPSAWRKFYSNLCQTSVKSATLLGLANALMLKPCTIYGPSEAFGASLCYMFTLMPLYYCPKPILLQVCYKQ